MNKHMKWTKKTMVILVAVAMVGAVLSTTTRITPSTVKGATEVLGTFTPTGASLSIACNKTTPAFGNINLGSSGENLSFNVTNEGNVACTVVMTAGQGTGGWTLVAGTVTSPATTNEYCVNMNPNATGYVDVQVEKTVVDYLKPSEGGVNYTYFDLKLFISEFTNEGTPGEQTFYANLTASEAS